MATINSLNIVSTGIVGYNGAGIWAASTFAQHSILVGGASNAITSIGPLVDGEIIIGSTGLVPVAATITAGSGISVVNGAGTITLSVAGGGLSWTVVAGAAQALVVNSGYFANNAGTVVFTLPATCAVGDVIAVSGMNNATGWSIAQNALQQIFFGSASTTIGVGGSLASTLTYDSVEMVCNVANTSFVVQSAVGNITFV